MWKVAACAVAIFVVGLVARALYLPSHAKEFRCSMSEAVSQIFLAYGLIGAVALILAFSTVFLFRELRASEKSRLDDMRPVITALESNARTLAAIATATENRTRSSDAISESVKLLTQEVEHLQKAISDLERRAT